MVEEEKKQDENVEEKYYYEKTKKKFKSLQIKESSRKSAFLSMFLLTLFFASVKVFATI